jgi:hypothetical protein
MDGRSMSDAKLSDGNKESAKELLSTYRTLFAINVSGLFLVATLASRGQLSFKSPLLAKIAIVLAAISLLIMIYQFFLILPKLYKAEDGIIYQVPVVVTSVLSFLLFCAAYILILLAVFR